MEVSTAGGNISQLVASFPNFHFAEVDGTDPLASYAALKTAVEYIRAGKGPAFVHGHVIRPYSHSLSDDEKLYRPGAERQSEVERDPITRFQLFLVREGILDEKAIDELEKDVNADVQEASDRAVEAALPAPGSYKEFVYSADLDPTSSAFQTEAVHAHTVRQGRGGREDHGRPHQRLPERRDEARSAHRDVRRGRGRLQSRRVSEGQAGEGQGRRLQADGRPAGEYGYERVFNSPLAEANIVGRAVGMATRGLKPVVEIQFFDYIWPAMQQLRNECR